MEFQKTEVLLEKSQYEILSQIAQEESRSLSEIIREIINRELQYRQGRQMMLAARELQVDYLTDPALTEFTALDSDGLHFEDDVQPL